jgi:hypothetical protein
MSETVATVVTAIVGALTTLGGGIAGLVFSERRSNAEHAASRQLAEHEREHLERERRGERLYSARRETYVDLLRQLLVERQIVERTENPESTRAPPAMPPEIEYNDLRARVWAFGSREVNAAVDAFDSNVRKFHETVELYAEDAKAGQAQGGKEGVLRSHRGRVTEGYEELRELIRKELATL